MEIKTIIVKGNAKILAGDYQVVSGPWPKRTKAQAHVSDLNHAVTKQGEGVYYVIDLGSRIEARSEAADISERLAYLREKAKTITTEARHQRDLLAFDQQTEAEHRIVSGPDFYFDLGPAPVPTHRHDIQPGDRIELQDGRFYTVASIEHDLDAYLSRRTLASKIWVEESLLSYLLFDNEMIKVIRNS